MKRIDFQNLIEVESLCNFSGARALSAAVEERERPAEEVLPDVRRCVGEGSLIIDIFSFRNY